MNTSDLNGELKVLQSPKKWLHSFFFFPCQLLTIGPGIYLFIYLFWSCFSHHSLELERYKRGKDDEKKWRKKKLKFFAQPQRVSFEFWVKMDCFTFKQKPDTTQPKKKKKCYIDVQFLSNTFILLFSLHDPFTPCFHYFQKT